LSSCYNYTILTYFVKSYLSPFCFCFIMNTMFKLSLKKFAKIKKHICEHKKRYLLVLGILLIIVIFIGGLTIGYFSSKSNKKSETQQIQQNVYVNFALEIYDKIQTEHWNKVSDEELSNLFRLAAEKLLEAPQKLSSADKNGLATMITETTQNMEEAKKKEFIASVANLVLVNLKPFGRSALYTQKLKQELANKVQNVNPENNLYSVLGVREGATQKELDDAYAKKVSELTPQIEKPEIKEEMEKVEYAYKVLSDEENKERYDESKTEPTVLGKLIGSDVLYLYMPRVSPTTLNDLKRETEKFDKGDELNNLILDLRGNIGGSLDVLPYLLGPFIGPNNYAFELFKQGEYEPFKTKFGWLPSLVRYKKVAILVDGNTQSSAEVMTATFKKYNVGIVIGTKTKGWGTIEAVYKLENQINEEEEYSVFLVNHLTVRDDGQSIEENGVEPTIDISDKDWEKQLLAYFNHQEFVNAVKRTLNSEPGKI